MRVPAENSSPVPERSVKYSEFIPKSVVYRAEEVAEPDTRRLPVVVAPPLIVRPPAWVPSPIVEEAWMRIPPPPLGVMTIPEDVAHLSPPPPPTESVPQIICPDESVSRVSQAPVARKRLVVEAVVAKSEVVVAEVVVERVEVKFGNVESAEVEVAVKICAATVPWTFNFSEGEEWPRPMLLLLP